MNTVESIVSEFVETFPSPLHPGVLYVSVPYSTAAHLCCCGCGNEIVTPLSRAQWTLTFDGQVSLRPSIGNWTLPCRSHYLIDAGQIRWARNFTDARIKANRQNDRRLLTLHRSDPKRSREDGLGATVAGALRRIWRSTDRR